jgi:hypothetical protein
MANPVERKAQDRGSLAVSRGSFDAPFFAEPTLNAFMAQGRAVWTATRQEIQALLAHDNPRLRDDQGEWC